jgi:hypothetical protein
LIFFSVRLIHTDSKCFLEEFNYYCVNEIKQVSLLFVIFRVWMDVDGCGWMHGWMDVDGWMWMDVDGWMWMDVDGCMDGWMWMDG